MICVVPRLKRTVSPGAGVYPLNALKLCFGVFKLVPLLLSEPLIESKYQMVILFAHEMKHAVVFQRQRFVCRPLPCDLDCHIN
jgi:hypothetical protein